MAKRIYDADPYLSSEFEASRALHRASRPNGPDCENWADPDMGVLGMHRRTPPALPIDAFGPAWRDWILNAAEAAACPPDYVAAPLLSAA